MTYLRSFSDHWHIRSMSFAIGSSIFVLSSVQRTLLAPCSIFSLPLLVRFRGRRRPKVVLVSVPDSDSHQTNSDRGWGRPERSGSPAGRGRSHPLLTLISTHIHPRIASNKRLILIAMDFISEH